MPHADCCGGDDDLDPLACPLCGGLGASVPAATIRAMLSREMVDDLDGPTGFRFCRDGDCSVVYYAPGHPVPVDKSALPMAVGVKEPDDPNAVMCYCFGISRREVTGGTAVSASIRARIETEGCDCKIKNPQGRCCLPEVEAAER